MTSIGLFWSPLLKSGAFSSLTAGFLVTVADGLVAGAAGLVTEVEGLVAGAAGLVTVVEGLETDVDGFLAGVGDFSVTEGVLDADGLVTVVPRLVEAVLLLTEGLVAVPLERGATPDGLEAVPEGRLTCLSEEAVLLDVVREALVEVPVLLLVVCASTSD